MSNYQSQAIPALPKFTVTSITPCNYRHTLAFCDVEIRFASDDPDRDTILIRGFRIACSYNGRAWVEEPGDNVNGHWFARVSLPSPYLEPLTEVIISAWEDFVATHRVYKVSRLPNRIFRSY